VKYVCTARQAAARHQASQQQGAKNQYGPLTTAGPPFLLCGPDTNPDVLAASLDGSTLQYCTCCGDSAVGLYSRDALSESRTVLKCCDFSTGDCRDSTLTWLFIDSFPTAWVFQLRVVGRIGRIGWEGHGMKLFSFEW
jgi:hypothetical protein